MIMLHIATELNCQKCCVWNGHGHMTMLPMAIPDAEASAAWFLLCVVAE